MDRIIEIQIRLLIGTIVMWIAASLIFGANLSVYGITNVIRMATYIQGALLIVTSVGWPHELYSIVIDGLYWLLEVNTKYNIVTRNIVEEVITPPKVVNIEDQFLADVEHELEKDVSTKDRTAGFLLAVENSIRGQMPVGIGTEEERIEERRDLDVDEKLRFDALWVAIDNIETARMMLLGEEFRAYNAVPENTISVPTERIIEEA